ncbi:MAG: methyltransferase domain-containing protein [Flavobacteriales bacterium]|nr:methyltransferase domain-containing protein [Flavobacteriales bacterium]
MFFPERITGIKDGDRVLEIGPGADPHPRSDVLLEMAFDDPVEYAKQFGHNRPLATQKELVFYDGITFPFADKAFDYVICSHVLEHVPDVEGFTAEVFRVGRRGYFEYPLAYYEYLYNFDVHLNFVKYSNGALNYMRKSDSHLDEFRPIQEFFHKTLTQGHTKTIEDLTVHFMEGFQWDAPFAVARTMKLIDVCTGSADVPLRTDRQLYTYGPKRLLKEFFRSLARRGEYQ